MSNIMDLVENKNTSEFYPTPERLIDRMLDGVDWRCVGSILEPSAGKGDILKAIAIKSGIRYGGKSTIDADAIEVDPNLREIIKYNFSKDRERITTSRLNELERKKWNEGLSLSEKDEKANLEIEKYEYFDSGVHIVCDDFLKFHTYKSYNLIVMNPPFSEGDKHLLKAIDIQKNGGDIICLLNAETIKNPCTNRRAALVDILEDYNASIEYVRDAFASAERSTNVEVAIVKIHIPRKEAEDSIFEKMKKAERVEEFQTENTELALNDYIKAAIAMYNAEVRTGIELIRQLDAFQPYNKNSFTSQYKKPILNFKDSDGNDVYINSFLKAVRYKYWEALLSNPKFVGRLTTSLQQEFFDKIRSLQDYDFTEYNIKTLSAEINSQIKRGVEDEIEALFEQLTVAHSCYEFQKNIHYYNGWKTNKAYKIGKKVILPCYGVYDSWDGKPRAYDAQSKVQDIERVLNFLDGNMTREIDCWQTIEQSFKNGVTSNIELKFFKVTFYKKGTMHITFTNEKLIERFNIYAAQRRGWLPPSYGKKKYKDMSGEEQDAINAFQGEEAYNKVLSDNEYYLAPVTKENLLTTAA